MYTFIYIHTYIYIDTYIVYIHTYLFPSGSPFGFTDLWKPRPVQCCTATKASSLGSARERLHQDPRGLGLVVRGLGLVVMSFWEQVTVGSFHIDVSLNGG